MSAPISSYGPVEYICSAGHQSASTRPLARCPHCVQGRPCTALLRRQDGPQAPSAHHAALLTAVAAQAPLEVLYTGRWYQVASARPLRQRIEVTFTTGRGAEHTKAVRPLPSVLRPKQAS